MLEMFFMLLIAHAVCDYPLQGDFIGRFKNRHVKPPEGMPPKTWVHLMTAHSLIHAGGVWLVTGSFVLALSEFVLHWWIDFIKCEGETDLNYDQLLHVLCKILYTVFVCLIN